MAKPRIPSNANWSGVTSENRKSKWTSALVASNDKPITHAHELNKAFSVDGDRLQPKTKIDPHL